MIATFIGWLMLFAMVVSALLVLLRMFGGRPVLTGVGVAAFLVAWVVLALELVTG